MENALNSSYYMTERRIVMKFINTRKFTWIICIIGFLLALVSIFFLPSIIPVHFANGIADDYGRKIQIFLFANWLDC